MKSGPGHYAQARFDAINLIAQTHFTQLESEATAVESDVDDLLIRISELNTTLDDLSASYPELSDQESRSRRTLARSQALASEIAASAGYSPEPRQRRSGTHRTYDDEGGGQEARPAAAYNGSEPMDIVDVEPPEDAPITLSGIFVRKRAGGNARQT